MKTQLLGFLIICCVACNTQKTDTYTPDKAAVDKVLDDWHNAAAEADFERYFNHFENDSSIFMGTDATERWTVAEFKPWSKPYFDRGKAWSFTPEERYIYFSDNGKIAWFDEALATPNLGPSRGTGVLTYTPNGWKISHYNLTVPIPNELIGTFIPQIDSVLNK
ncbi:DUF4440 domain-containing protein [Fulvivirga sp. RKSG066]|uniref:nuclear transport factor 2 family protein n=1 Tax=Fulvivirga aurantia TaxID=2529383 RepID=UPI0012BCD8B7|nr:nuclear transport factor 2 family protein [Fulvivirga aurantia]MTI21958.1 DUF4440 domain-containing protein [Fulvivirga aurantia]